MSQEADTHGGWVAPQSESTRETVNPIVQKALWACTGVLGLATWAVCLIAAAPQHLIATGAVLAGALAVIGLLPGQQVRGWLVVAVAVSSLAAAGTTTATTAGAGWILTVMDVLVALQVVVSIGALLLEPRAAAAPEDEYAAYARYVRAYQDYALGYGAQATAQYAAPETVDAHATGDARGEQDAWGRSQARYAHYVSPPATHSSEHQSRRAEGGVTPDSAVPSVMRADRPFQVPGTAVSGSTPTVPGT